MDNRRNYYRILHVQPDAPFEIIRTSYHTLMRDLKKHPDLGGDNWNASVLNEAYEILSDSKKRAEYNKQLLKNYADNNCLHTNSFRETDTNNVCRTHSKPMHGSSNAGNNCTNCGRPVSSKTGQSDHRNHRRSVIRMKSNGKIRYYHSSSIPGQDAALLDLSPEGVRFFCTEKLKERSTLQLESQIFDAKVKVLSAKQDVVDGRIHYVVGASFLNVSFHNKRGSFYSNTI
jgi:curved DNA-binding protein CbpA